MSDFHVVIPSANPQNLAACLGAFFRMEPDILPSRVVVVDDGGAAAVALFPGVRVVQGEKPFVFSRNCNIGIRAAATDVVLLNDDAILVSQRGLTRMSKIFSFMPNIGACSAAVFGRGHPSQFPRPGEEIRVVEDDVNFACVYLPKTTLDKVGMLDEQFTAYGGDDCDMDRRMRSAGLSVAVYDGCLVVHEDGHLTRPSFIHLQGFCGMSEEGERILKEKWEPSPESGQSTAASAQEQ